MLAGIWAVKEDAPGVLVAVTFGGVRLRVEGWNRLPFPFES